MRNQWLWVVSFVLAVGLLSCARHPKPGKVGGVTAAVAPLRAPGALTYQVPQGGNVSLGIYSGDGKLVRTLQSGKKLPAGQASIAWDGKDDAGQLAAPGRYMLKGLVANLGWEYITAGGNSGKPPYMTADGKGGWGGLWGNVMGAATDRVGGVYLLWAQEEGTPSLLKVNPDGGTGQFVVWGAHNNWDWGSCQALVTDGEYVYVANNQRKNVSPAAGATAKAGDESVGQIWRVKCDTGEFAFYEPEKLIKVSSLPQERVPALPPFYEMCADPAKRFPVSGWQNLFAIAVDGQNLYCSLQFENVVRVIDKRTGQVKANWPVPAPRGIAVGPNGVVYVVSGKRILKLSSAGQRDPVIESGLVAPYGLAIDSAGTFYVSDQGESMQIKRFSGGRLAGTIGRTGGRALGGGWKTNADSLLYPTHPAVAPDGTIYVGEDSAPKRVAVIKSGAIADSWIGPLSGGCSMMEIADPQDPQYLYHLSHLGHLVRYRVDYSARTCELDASWSYNVWSRSDNSIKRNAIYSVQDSGGGYIRHLNGRTYLCMNSWPLSIFQIDGYALIPATVLSSRIDARSPIDRISKDWKSRPAPAALPGTYYAWRDLNGDGEAQEDEVQWTPMTRSPMIAHNVNAAQPFVDEKMNVYMAGYYVPCKGFDAQGNPIYSWQEAKPLDAAPMGSVSTKLIDPAAKVDEQKLLYPGGRETNCWVDAEGFRYYACDVEGKGTGLGWASSGVYARLGKADASGNWIWLAGQKATAFAKPGQFYKIANIAGLERNCLFVCDWNGQARVFDKDTGLYAGSIFADGSRGPLPDENLISVEFTEAHVYTNPADHQVYAAAGDGNGLRVYRVIGLDQVKRFEQPVELKAPRAEPSAAPTTQAAGKGIEVQRILRAPGAVSIDGLLNDWDLTGKIGPASFDPDSAHQYNATFWAMYDTQNLYLAAKVVTPHPPYNNHLPGTAYWDGDAVIVRLLADAGQPLPPTIAESPRFASFSMWHNHQKQADYMTGYHGIRVHDLPLPADPGWAVKIIPADKGYTMEAKIPWSTVDAQFRPKPGDRIAFTWEVGIGRDVPTNPTRVFQIFAINGGIWAFSSPGMWGIAEFK